MHTDDAQPTSHRPLLAIFLLFTVPFLAGALISPYVFNGLRALGEITDALPKLTEARFERVASRCTILIAFSILYPIIKLTGLLPIVKQGLSTSRARLRALGSSFLIGFFSISILYAVGFYLGAYAVSPEFSGISSMAVPFIGYIIGAGLIGVFEEIFFRGFVFGGLRGRLGFLLAALISSVIFSGIHFLRPLYPEIIKHASWNTGFAIMPYMFERFIGERDGVFAVTLFLMGLTFATNYEKRGNLYFIIGLHGGWVLAMRTCSEILNRKREILEDIFGTGDLISKGWLALFMVILFYLAALLSKSRKTA